MRSPSFPALIFGALFLAGCGSPAPSAALTPTSAPPTSGRADVPAVLTTAAASVAATPSPSAGATVSRTGPAGPDAMIRLGPDGYLGGPTGTYHGPWVGSGIVNTTAAGQTVSGLDAGSGMVAGSFYTFDISILNAGSTADRFGVKASGSATKSWVVTYSAGRAAITAAIVGGTFQTPAVAPGGTYRFSARITINQGGTLAPRLVTIRSATDPAQADAVAFAFNWNTASPAPSAAGPQAVVQEFYDWFDSGPHSIAEIAARPELTAAFAASLKSFSGPASPIDCAQELPAWATAGQAAVSGGSALVKVDDEFSTPPSGIPVTLVLGPAGWQISAIECRF